ncbi:hypothetical protein BP00DRAFT_424574 [Aspergillus indologenus CBS 114.80]|uniref:Uncharacterized protein n=1 Tax=Aspergillus indologenus CBS 114.80 TaxID=1450541 RepID=A0A2V5JC98_9EURO|nr:hypothetical protein BP00DRAFT_424574 [Aspergillus indologenus CBS 114.80]
MPAVEGTISGSATDFRGQWTIHGSNYVFDGVTDQVLGKWESQATLEYINAVHLIGAFDLDDLDFPSHIGPRDFSLTFRDERGGIWSAG